MHEALVEGVEVVDHALEREEIPDQVPALGAELDSEGGVAGQKFQPFLKGMLVAGGHQVAGPPVDAHLIGAVAVIGDDRSADGESLGQGAGETLTAGQVDEHIHDPHVGGDIGGGDEPGEDEVTGELELGDLGFQGGASFTVAHDEESEVGQDADQGGSGGDEIVVALVFKEAGDFAGDEIVGMDAEALAQVGIVLGGEERLEIEAADDAGELVGATDAGGAVLAGHGIGDDDEVGGEGAGEAFGGAKGGVGGGALKGAERGAVDGVENDGDAGSAGGKSAEEAGFAAVGVDDIGLIAAQEGREGEPGSGVEQGVDGADEGGEEGEGFWGVVELGFDGSFGAGGGPADEVSFDAGQAAEAEDGGDRVLLGATHDEAGDDVGDPHGASG